MCSGNFALCCPHNNSLNPFARLRCAPGRLISTVIHHAGNTRLFRAAFVVAPLLDEWTIFGRLRLLLRGSHNNGFAGPNHLWYVNQIRRPAVWAAFGFSFASIPLWTLVTRVVNGLASARPPGDGHMSGILGVFLFFLLVGSLLPMALASLIVGLKGGRILARVAIAIAAVPPLVVAGLIGTEILAGSNFDWRDGELNSALVGSVIAAVAGFIGVYAGLSGLTPMEDSESD